MRTKNERLTMPQRIARGKARLAAMPADRLDPRTLSGWRATCKCCAHPQRDELDLALLGGATQREVAAAFGISAPTVNRHSSDCLVRALKALGSFEDPRPELKLAAAQYALGTFQRIIRRLELDADAARHKGNHADAIALNFRVVEVLTAVLLALGFRFQSIEPDDIFRTADKARRDARDAMR